MDETVQQCNGCGCWNLTHNKSWVRSLGAFNGAPLIATSNVPNTPGNAGEHSSVRDICEFCNPKLTGDMLVAITVNPKLFPFKAVTAPTTAAVVPAESAPKAA